jgi:hypothetical protein
MDRGAVEQLLDELLSSMEALEKRSAAILQFLKEEDYATEDQLAPYMEQAGNASNVRWRAARLRMMSLLNSAMRDETAGSMAESSAKDPKPGGKDTLASATSKDNVESESAQGSPAKSSAQRDRTAAASGQSPQTSATSEHKKGPGPGEEESAAPQAQRTAQSKNNARATDSTPSPNSSQSPKGPDIEQKSANAETQSEKTEQKPEKEDAA